MLKKRANSDNQKQPTKNGERCPVQHSMLGLEKMKVISPPSPLLANEILSIKQRNNVKTELSVS